MGTIVVQTFLTLDGVMQAPGAPDEDAEGGFEHGGWQGQYGDPQSTEVIGGWHDGIAALLFGRRTYEIFARSWGVTDPADAEGLEATIAADFHRVPKYVASRTLTEVAWQNSHLLGDDVPAAVAGVRGSVDGEIQVWGSGDLVQTLLRHGLVDELRLLVYPLVLGSGQRLFTDGSPVTGFELSESRGLANGAIAATYRPASGTPAGRTA